MGQLVEGPPVPAVHLRRAEFPAEPRLWSRVGGRRAASPCENRVLSKRPGTRSSARTRQSCLARWEIGHRQGIAIGVRPAETRVQSNLLVAGEKSIRLRARPAKPSSG